MPYSAKKADAMVDERSRRYAKHWAWFAGVLGPWEYLVLGWVSC
ncbi:hypothetical protein I553_2486 [Mycobacterium xenopi 4042]|uniref:Uncharacterized protein n=2 Tax=Mycobacterium xenopi TaxID=1789 RepID=A0AAD1H4E8_MYCXE|nr:hypothetical protein I552_6802 [Mycobacterium xenopi 3993]EUA52300.1 hypothetical protein I553_2486 [Mycobacterium xenopi 4042]BBU24320.1 hypothetical protein MYXE_41100 [Mycobacterium xenopi]SPX90377.1 Uncharacterised protein [Mycobacterium xenopi]